MLYNVINIINLLLYISESVIILRWSYPCSIYRSWPLCFNRSEYCI